MLLFSTGVMAQSPAYSISKDSVDGGLIFNGPITISDLENEATFKWMKSGLDDYKPYDGAVSFLKTYLKDYSLVVFMGTWCDDSQNLVPKLAKVLQMADFPLSKLTMYGTDRAKKTKNAEEKKYDVSLVPTIIVLKNGKEKGRITESVKKTIEDDLAAIVAF